MEAVKRKGPIVCLGLMVADLIGGPVREFPERGGLSLVENMGLFTGGGAVNTAIALARLGLPVNLMGKVGNDPLGHFVVEELDRAGVGIEGVSHAHGIGTSATMVMVDPDGERRFIHYTGANACLEPSDISTTLIGEASLLLVAGYFVMPGMEGRPCAEILHRARDAGAGTLLDTTWDVKGRWLSSLQPCLPFVDFFLPSLAEARAMTGLHDPVEAARALLQEGASTVIMKMGVDGCLVVEGSNDAFHCPAYEVEVVDTTGAGDAFAAGFMAGLWHGWTLEEAAWLANAVGALCVSGMGAKGRVTSLADTLAFMSATPTRDSGHKVDLRRKYYVETE